MAYNCWYSGSNIADYDGMLDTVVSGFEACGWDLHDAFTGTYKTRVVKCQGEGDYHRPAYIEFWHQNTWNVYFRPWMFWNASTHTGVVQGYYSASYSYLNFTVGHPLICYGDRDWIVLHSISASPTWYIRQKQYGFIKRYDDNLVTLTQNATSGNNKVLTVSGSLGKFVDVRYYKIVGDETEGRDTIYVNSITGSTVTGTLAITNLPRDYDAGAIIGHTPYVFTSFQENSNGFRTLCDYHTTSAGLTNTTNLNVSSVLLTVGGVDPDGRTNRHILQPTFLTEIASVALNTPIGYLTSSGIGRAPTTGMAAYSANVLYTTGSFESGSSTGSSTATMLNDSSKAWTTNEHAGKVFVYTSGSTTGEGQTRVIASNDATNLYWNTPLYETPQLSHEYRIYTGEVWRRVYQYACRELIY